MTQEEKYINFLLNYNKKLEERDDVWLDPDDLGAVIIETATQNEPDIAKNIAKEIRDMGDMFIKK